MSSNSLTLRFAVVCVLASGLLCANAVPARGQIATLAEQDGRTVFVNAIESPAPVGKRARISGLHASRGVAGSGRVTLAPAAPPPEIAYLVDKTAGRMQVDPKLVHAVIQVESGYNPRAVSSKGAEGLMQLMPSTAERFGVENSFNPKQNIEGGVSYLKYLLELFGGNVPLSVAAYNAGEHAVLRNGGIPRIAETVNYVERVTSLYGSRDALLRQAEKPSIARTVDEHGLVHYTNDGL